MMKKVKVFGELFDDERIVYRRLEEYIRFNESLEKNHPTCDKSETLRRNILDTYVRRNISMRVKITTNHTDYVYVFSGLASG